MQNLSEDLESTERQIGNGVSMAADVTQAGAYKVQMVIQEQPETQKQLSDVKVNRSGIAQQNSQVISANDLRA